MAAVYFSVTTVLLCILALGSKTSLKDHALVRVYVYSLLFPLYSILWGFVTRLFSCKPSALLYSLALMTTQIIVVLYGFRFIYKNQAYGLENLGLSYVVITFVFMLIPYLICHGILFLIDRLRSNKVVARIARERKPQLSVENPLITKVYNKKYNRYEKYLMWNNGTKTKTSDRIIYYDYVELVAVDSSHRVYAFKTPPKRTKEKEAFRLLSATSETKGDL